MTQTAQTATDDAAAAARRDRDIHNRATELRRRLSLAKLIEALYNAGATEAEAILEAARGYDDAELGKLVSRRIQAYCRGIANYEQPEPVPVMLRKQAD